MHEASDPAIYKKAFMSAHYSITVRAFKDDRTVLHKTIHLKC